MLFIEKLRRFTEMSKKAEISKLSREINLLDSKLNYLKKKNESIQALEKQRSLSLLLESQAFLRKKIEEIQNLNLKSSEKLREMPIMYDSFTSEDRVESMIINRITEDIKYSVEKIIDGVIKYSARQLKKIEKLKNDLSAVYQIPQEIVDLFLRDTEDKYKREQEYLTKVKRDTAQCEFGFFPFSFEFFSCSSIIKQFINILQGLKQHLINCKTCLEEYIQEDKRDLTDESLKDLAKFSELESNIFTAYLDKVDKMILVLSSNDPLKSITYLLDIRFSDIELESYMGPLLLSGMKKQLFSVHQQLSLYQKELDSLEFFYSYHESYEQISELKTLSLEDAIQHLTNQQLIILNQAYGRTYNESEDYSDALTFLKDYDENENPYYEYMTLIHATSHSDHD